MRVFLLCHLRPEVYVVPSYACLLPPLLRASSNTASSVKSPLTSTRINVSLFSVARAIYTPFGSLTDSLIH